jgi:hypothetical protein
MSALYTLLSHRYKDLGPSYYQGFRYNNKGEPLGLTLEDGFFNDA